MTTVLNLTMPSGQVLPAPATPHTWIEKATGVYGDPLQAKLMESSVAMAVAFHRQRPLMQGVATVTTSLTSSTWTPLPLAELCDNVAGHSDVSNVSRWFMPAAATSNNWWLCTGLVPVNTSSVSTVAIAGLRINGGGVQEGAKIPGGGHNGITPMTVDLLQMTAGDYIELMAYQNSGGSVSTIISGRAATLTLRWACAGTGTTVALPSTPRTWLAADAITADSTGGANVPLNLHIRDVIRWLNYPAIAKVTASGTTQTIASGVGTWTSLQMPASTVDNYGMWSSGANTKLTCQRAGLYLVAGLASIQEGSSNTGYRAARLLHTIAAGGSATYAGTVSVPATTSTIGTAIQVVHLIRMAVNDTVELQASHNQGSSLNAGTASRLIAVWRSL